MLDNAPVTRKRYGAITVQKHRTEAFDEVTLKWKQRMLYALDLETAMRGLGWSWTSADVRHTTHTWLPSLRDEIEQLVFRDIVTVTLALLLERYLYRSSDPSLGIESLGWIERSLLTLSLGVFLFGMFSAGYTAGAILTEPLRTRHRVWTTHNLAFWPPLNSEPLTSACTVRQFWSRSWHRLFSRLFLVWGVWPGQFIQASVMPAWVLQRYDPTLDVGKVIGAFCVSGIVHAAAGISINGGRPSQTFEWLFFWSNGVAILIEEVVCWTIVKSRGDKSSRWHDPWIRRVWTAGVLLLSGQYFTKGWYDSGLVEEMVTLPVAILRSAVDSAIMVLQCIRDIA